MEKYSITLTDLLERPVIRKDHPEEWMNKMTDEELETYYLEVEEKIKNDKSVEDKFPDVNAARISEEINRTVLYRAFKLG